MKTAGLLRLIILLLPIQALADVDNREIQIKAAYLYKFCLYVKWPESTFDTTTSTLKIGVIGNEDLARELQRVVANRQVNERSIQLQYIDSNSNIDNLHVLYLGNETEENLGQLAERAAQLAILTVTEQKNKQPIPRVIDFILSNNRIRFDVDLHQANEVGLRLSAELLAVAREVNKSTSGQQ